jgi:hypothetical protein
MAVTRDDLAAALADLAAIEHLLAARTAIIRVIVDEKGHEVGRIYRGSFYQEENNEHHR